MADDINSQIAMAIKPLTTPSVIAAEYSTAPINFDAKTHLVISSAGARGFAYSGAMDALQEQGYGENIEAVAGTSAGGMMALLFSLNYQGSDYDNVIYNYDFGKLSSLDMKKILQIPENLKQDGLFAGKEISDWAEFAIAQRTGQTNMDFCQMHEYRQAAHADNAPELFEAYYENALNNLAENKHQFGDDFSYSFACPEEMLEQASKMRPLTLAATRVDKDPDDVLRDAASTLNIPISDMDIDLKKQLLRQHAYSSVYFNTENSPNISVSKALEASASIPFIFARQTIDGVEYSDGGIGDSFAYEAFEQAGVQPENILGLGTISATKDKQKEPILERLLRKVGGRAWPSMEPTQAMFSENSQAERKESGFRDRTVMVNTANYSAYDFKLSSAEIRELSNWGKQEMNQQIKRFKNQDKHIAQSNSQQVTNPPMLHNAASIPPKAALSAARHF